MAIQTPSWLKTGMLEQAINLYKMKIIFLYSLAINLPNLNLIKLKVFMLKSIDIKTIKAQEIFGIMIIQCMLLIQTYNTEWLDNILYMINKWKRIFLLKDLMSTCSLQQPMQILILNNLLIIQLKLILKHISFMVSILSK